MDAINLYLRNVKKESHQIFEFVSTREENVSVVITQKYLYIAVPIMNFYNNLIDGRANNDSYAGAMSRMHSPSLWLNLSTGGDDVKIYLVRHEFGHALGLLHEHQRPDLWQNIREFMDLEKMDRELGSDAERNFGEEKFWSFDNSTKYDPESIMHYP